MEGHTIRKNFNPAENQKEIRLAPDSPPSWSNWKSRLMLKFLAVFLLGFPFLTIIVRQIPPVLNVFSFGTGIILPFIIYLMDVEHRRLDPIDTDEERLFDLYSDIHEDEQYN